MQSMDGSSTTIAHHQLNILEYGFSCEVLGAGGLE